MGMAFETVVYSAVAPGAGGAVASVAASGDVAAVRYFEATDGAFLEVLTRAGTTAGFGEVRSPNFHDAVNGMRITPGENPSVFAMPGIASEPLVPGDVPTVLVAGGGAGETDLVALSIYYPNLPGSQAVLHNWADLAGLVRHIKTIPVAIAAPAVAGAWTDTPINTTDATLKADSYYAVIGYTSSVAGGVLGVRGAETGNYRMCGPASTSEFPTSQYFAYLSEKTGRPHIPVFNGSNQNAFFVSVNQPTALAADVATIVLAQLSQKP